MAAIGGSSSVGGALDSKTVKRPNFPSSKVPGGRETFHLVRDNTRSHVNQSLAGDIRLQPVNGRVKVKRLMLSLPKLSELRPRLMSGVLC